MTTEVTMHNEGARRALLFALWQNASHDVGERFHDLLALEADASLTGNDQPDTVTVVTEQMKRLRATLGGVAEVSMAQAGDCVKLDISPANLACGLESCRTAISAEDDFWRMGAQDRARTIETHDAAARLLDALSGGTVAA